MPLDHYDEDEEEKKSDGVGVKRRFKEFDCPSCNANNPCDPPIGNGDEVLCNYCGSEYSVSVNEDGRMKMRET